MNARQQPQSEKASDFVDAIVEQDAKNQAEPKREYRPRRSAGPVAAVLTFVLAGLTSANLWLASQDPEPFSPIDVEATAILDLLVASETLEEYRGENGHLPDDLLSINADADGLTYSIRNARYELQAQAGNTLLSFSEGDDPTWLHNRFQALLP